LGSSTATEDAKSGMTESEFAAVTHELDQIVAKLKESRDPRLERKL